MFLLLRCLFFGISAFALIPKSFIALAVPKILFLILETIIEESESRWEFQDCCNERMTVKIRCHVNIENG